MTEAEWNFLKAMDAKLDRLLAIVDKPKVKRKVKEPTPVELFHTAAFNCWWKEYPKKRGDKKKCLAIWIKNDLSRLRLIADVQNRVANDQQWQDVQYVPNPQTYLNGKLWENDLIPIKTKVDSPQSDMQWELWAANNGIEASVGETMGHFIVRLKAIHNGANV